jgi:hypothetical protein
VLACSLSHQRGSPEVIRDLHGLFVDDSMRLEHRIDIAGDAGSVVSQGHSGAAHDEYVCHDASANEALTQRGECPFKLCPANDCRPRSRGLQVPGGQVDAVLSECRWCPDQCIGPLDFQFRREPRLLQDSHLSPLRWGKIVLRRQVLC